MTGDELCTELKRSFKIKTNSALAKILGVSPARVTQICNTKKIEAKYAAKIIAQIPELQTKDALTRAIRPIVELFEVTPHQIRENGRLIPFSRSTDDGKKLHERLINAAGIYSFYNSQTEIIYFRKTERNDLYHEMVDAFNRNLPNYTLYRVKHPSGRFKPRSNEKLRQIRKSPVTLAETASYFSAYSVSEGLISGIEALFIRISPNDIINVRMERSKFTAFPEPEV
jgi:hypothetical protein